MGLKRTVSLTTHKKIWEAADIIWDLQKIPELKLRMEELKVLHGEYTIKMRKGIPVDYVFDISGAGPEGEKIIIDLKPSPAGTEIRITSKSFLTFKHHLSRFVKRRLGCVYLRQNVLAGNILVNHSVDSLHLSDYLLKSAM